MRTLVSIGLALAALSIAPLAAAQAAPPAPAPSDAPASPAPRSQGVGFMAGAKVGGLVNFNGLSPFVTAGVEVGYAFPWLDRAFALKVDLDYTQPVKSSTQMDPRVMGGSYSRHLLQQELNLMPLVMYRMTFLKKVVPYVGIGPRIYFMKQTVRSGDTGPNILETTEKGTKVGFGIPVGTEIRLGPGGLIAEALFQYGGLDHVSTGDTNTGGISLAVGYRFLL